MRTVDNLLSSGVLVGPKIGGARRITIESIDRAAAERGTLPTKKAAE